MASINEIQARITPGLPAFPSMNRSENQFRLSGYCS
jgi:hypothetical protein